MGIRSNIIILISLFPWIGSMSAGAEGLQKQRLAELFRKPGVIGDSMSQGFFAATVEDRTQEWAFPVLVSKQAGMGQLRYNKFRGPYINLQRLLQLNCGPVCLAKEITGDHEDVYLPNHVAVSGADYTDVLYRNSKCKDLREKTCAKPDKYHQWTLADWGTQMEIIERVRPSFLFLNAAANHALCVALATKTDCLNKNRFMQDFGEVVRRVKAISSIRGGVMFTVPDVTTVRFLVYHQDPQGRAELTGYKPMIRKEVSHPDQVLDAQEIARTQEFIQMVNQEIRKRAKELNFAVADIHDEFIRMRAGEVRLVAKNGYSPGLVHASWPLSGEPGVLSLDGVHPNKMGHALIANRLIDAINAHYSVEIEHIDEYAAWYFDSLNQKPVDLQGVVNSWGVKSAVNWLLNLLRPSGSSIFGDGVYEL